MFERYMISAPVILDNQYKRTSSFEPLSFIIPPSNLGVSKRYYGNKVSE